MKPNGSACDDANFCTVNDLCQNGVCQGTQSQTCNGQVATQGYWMNHPEAWCMQTITIGCMTYTKAQAIAIMQQPTSTDMTYAMFSQLIATRLNVNCAASNASCVAGAISAGENFLCQNQPGSGVKASSSTWKNVSSSYDTLDKYNSGKLCAPARK